MKTRLLDTTALTDFLPRNICFAEADADDGAAPAGAGGGAPANDSADDSDGGGEAEEFIFEEEGTEGEGAAADDDSDELEIGAAKHRVPKAVKEAWNGIQKSTQAEKEAIAAKEQQYQNNMRMAASYMKEIGRIQAIDEQVADYEKLTPADWITWAAQDQAKASQAQIGYNALIQEKQKLLQSVQEKENNLKSQQERERSEFIARAERELATKIKNWSPEKKASLIKVGSDLGFSPQELQQVSHDPRVMGMLDEVREAREAKARARKTVEEAKATRVAEGGKPEPVGRSRGNAGAANSLGDHVPMDQWAKNFNKRRGKGR